jgi:hypothetical protein
MGGLAMESISVPEACFKAEPELYAPDPSALPKALAGLLQSQTKKTPFLRMWTIEVPMQAKGANGFAVGVRRSPYGENEWIAILAPPVVGNPLGYIWRRGRVARSTPQLLQVCRQIHGALTETPGVSLIRWYFQTSDRSRPVAVWTPDDLLGPTSRGN